MSLLKKIRKNHAYRLLSGGDVTVAEAALASGFSDEKYFSGLFKRTYGISPSQIKGATGV